MEMITLQAGEHTVVLKPYLTGAQALELKREILRNQKMSDFNMAEMTASISDLSYTVDIEEKAIQMLLVSLDDSSERAYDRLKELPANDFEIVLNKVNEIRGEGKGSKKNEEKSVTSSETSTKE